MQKCYACWSPATSKKMRTFPSTGMMKEVYQCDRCSMHTNKEFEASHKYHKQKRKDNK